MRNTPQESIKATMRFLSSLSIATTGLCIISIALFICVSKAFSITDWTSHLLPYSSVDTGEIRWGGSNWYSSNPSSAISSWNGLGTINIAADTASTYEDLRFSDVYRSDLTWVGLHTYWGAATDTIEMNNYYLEQYSPVIITNVFVHELGHALGLAGIYDPDYSKYGPWPSVMYGYVDAMPNGIQSSDIDNYNYKW